MDRYSNTRGRLTERPKPLEPQAVTKGAFPGAVNGGPFGGFPIAYMRITETKLVAPNRWARFRNWITGQDTIYTVTYTFDGKVGG